MSTEFSNLEVQLIRSSLVTRTDEEIAELLDRPVEEIKSYINGITGGDMTSRNAEVLKHKQETGEKKKYKRKINPAVEKQKKEKAEARKLRDLEERRRRQAIEDKRKAELKFRSDRRLFATREIDMDQMQSVKVDAKTWILVPKGQDERLAIANYQHYQNKKAFKNEKH